jgi:hypothetical protein
MANMSRTDALPFLEEMYVNSGLLKDLVFRNRPLLSILQKSHMLPAGGKYVHVPITYAIAQGRSAGFTNAQTNYKASQGKSFDVTYRNNYQIGAIDGDVITDAQGNTTLFTDALSREMDMVTENLTNDVSYELFGNNGGARGKMTAGSNPGTPTITLTNPEDTINFEVGQVLQTSTTDGTTGVVKTGTVTLSAIDRVGGTLTATGNWTAGIATAAASDFIFADGDFGNKMAGLGAWDPATAPGATTFFGVDRTADTRLGGLRYTTGTGSIDQILIQAAAFGARFGAKFDLGVLNPVKFGDLTTALETQSRRIRRTTVMGSGDAANFGFEALVLDTDRGSVPIISDPSCPVADCRLLNTDGIKLGYSGSSLIHIITDDGNETLRQTSQDGVEFRVKSRGNMLVYNPGHQLYVGV